MRWIKILTVFVGTLIGVSAQTAHANQFGIDTSDFGPEGVWNNYCEIDRMTDMASCRLYIYRLYENGREVEYVSLSVIPTGGSFAIFLSTSEGLIDSCSIRVDRQDKIDTRMASINMCVFADVTGAQVVEQFRNGSALLVRSNFLRAGRRDVDFTLSGFTRNFEEMQRAMHIAQR
ncbi:hypothetical protein [Arenibaculum sp.]|uniref:hypothetical protein n=1 Tax=Arenibaculum sp. TaxID=2865862 RepID=UPI002E14F876|nr:hypothetical protein [Arenibaculum sp.]